MPQWCSLMSNYSDHLLIPLHNQCTSRRTFTTFNIVVQLNPISPLTADLSSNHNNIFMARCMVHVFSALTLLVGQQEGHLACKKTEWWGAGMVICLERGAATLSCFSKIQTGFTFLVPAHPGSPEKRAVKWVCVCVCHAWFMSRSPGSTGPGQKRPALRTTHFSSQVQSKYHASKL